LERHAAALAPTGGGAATLRVGVRLPSGARHEQLFDSNASCSLFALFAWVDALSGVIGGAVEGVAGDYALASAFPRRTLRRPPGEQGTLAEAGLDGGAVMLNLEPAG
jgi:hypothetical protein